MVDGRLVPPARQTSTHIQLGLQGRTTPRDGFDGERFEDAREDVDNRLGEDDFWGGLVVAAERVRSFETRFNGLILDISSEHNNNNNPIANDEQQHALMRSANGTRPSSRLAESTGDSIVEEARERGKKLLRAAQRSFQVLVLLNISTSSRKLRRPDSLTVADEPEDDSSDSC